MSDDDSERERERERAEHNGVYVVRMVDARRVRERGEDHNGGGGDDEPVPEARVVNGLVVRMLDQGLHLRCDAGQLRERNVGLGGRVHGAAERRGGGG